MMQDEKIVYQAQIFSNRLQKKYKYLSRWARKNNIWCYRLYNKDIPEIPLLLDIWTLESSAEKKEIFIVLCLYERPYDKDSKDEIIWLNVMQQVICNVLGIEKSHIIIKTRKRQKGNLQYTKVQEAIGRDKRITQENNLRFWVDLYSYLDTGLFLDLRTLRQKVREVSNEKRVLNLFSYTGAFSVYAASGGAKVIDSVDLSNTYTNWAINNMKLNNLYNKGQYNFICEDVNKFLQDSIQLGDKTGYYDIIILDPPTFSNSKAMRKILDINKDWIYLIKRCLILLNNDGVLYFSYNSKTLKFNEKLLPQNIKTIEISRQIVDKDMQNKSLHKCYKLRKYL